MAPRTPEQAARDSVHKDPARQKGTCAADDKTSGKPCDCHAPQRLIDEMWMHRARMARARQAAGRSIQPTGKLRRVRIGDNVFRFERTFVAIAEAELDDIDREALRRHP